MERIRVTTTCHAPEYEVVIGDQVLKTVGENARFWLGNSAKKIALISNPAVFGLYGREVVRSLNAWRFAVSRILIPEGERSKNLETVLQNLLFLSNNRIERTDAVLSLGGGVIGDIAGFTAAIYLRGIRFIYVPTTLLAQIDSSIGGKTGVNLPRGKNQVGVFHSPAGVLTDVATLRTLPHRELVSGLFECIKQGAVSNVRLFNQTMSMLDSRHRSSNDAFVEMISAHCKFKATIVKRDEREQLNGINHRSRRVLNFGHTVGHALETVTKYRRFRHGEAVAIGMLAAGEISKNVGLLSANDLLILTEAVARCGPLPKTDDLNERMILNAIKFDKKSASGAIHWVLLEKIGKPRIVSGEQIDAKIIARSLRQALTKAATFRS